MSEQLDELTPRLEPAADAPEPAVPDGPTFVHRPPKHGLIGPFGGRQLAVGLAIVLLTGVLIVAITTPLGQTGGQGLRDPAATAYVIDPSATGIGPGQRAPELSVTRADGSTFQLNDLDGKPVRLADLRGKGVWINFWATWCPPCQSETPVLRDTYAAYRDRGLVLIGVAVQETSVDDIRRYAQTYGLGYTVAFDTSGDIFHEYKNGVLPTQYFIDPNGVIRAHVLGPLDAASAAQYVESILPGSAGSSGG